MSERVSNIGSALYRVLDPPLRLLENVAVVVAGLLMLIAMVLVSADALLRYLVNAPLTFQYYLTEKYLMVGLVCLSLAWGFRTGGHIRIEGLVQHLPKALSNAVLRVGLLVSAGYIAVLGWLGGKHFLHAFRLDEVVIGVFDWPVAWSWVWIPLGCGLLALRLLLTALGPTAKLHEKHEHAEEHA